MAHQKILALLLLAVLVVAVVGDVSERKPLTRGGRKALQVLLDDVSSGDDVQMVDHGGWDDDDGWGGWGGWDDDGWGDDK
ncbi:hypothetical protein BSKO_14124 [Bryopsis sp. KO-2023]|nr:hypothetical protein BSKO_14124 [Bryopsis sp. KO-2023]